MSTEALIELDAAPPVGSAPSRPPSHRYRAAGLALAALVVLMSAGATPPAPVVWERAGLVPAVAGDVVYEVARDRVYIASVIDDVWWASAYALRPFRRLWNVPTQGSTDVPMQLQAAGDQVLVQLGASTVVLDADRGAVRWVSPIPVQPLSGGRTGLVQQEQFRPGSEYDTSSGDPGPLYFSSTGVPHTRPPERTVVRGVDLATGTAKWSTEAAGSVFAAPATAAPATMVLVSAERLQILDAETGALLRERLLPRIAGAAVAWSEIIGDLVTVRHSAPAGDTVGAYGLGDLEPRWQRTQPGYSGNSRTCTGLPCEQTTSALDVLDPVTGSVRWRTDGSVDVLSRGPYALEVDAAASPDPRPVRTVQLATGATGVDLAAWRAYARSPADAPLVLMRDDGAAGTAFGVLTPGQRVVRPLGHSADEPFGCQSDHRLVACRTGSGVQVWSYRA